MDCPYCGADSRVLDSRPAEKKVRRRRECLECGRRFTTYERLAESEIRVLKRNGETEGFDRDKLLELVRRLTRRRPVTEKAKGDLVRGLEAELVDSGAPAVPSSRIAEKLLARLDALDPIAAARFRMSYQDEDGVVRLASDEPAPQLQLPLEAEQAPPAGKAGRVKVRPS